MQGEKANILQAILGYLVDGRQGDIETLLALLIKSHPHKIAKQSIEGAGFSVLRNMEAHEAIQFRSTPHLPMNTYKRMQRIMTNFGYDKHFFPSHRITLEQQKMISHISKDTCVTEKMRLNISSDKSQQVSVMYVKDLKQYIDSIVKNLDLQGKLQYNNFDGNLWLLFTGDKEEKHMKIYFEIINCKDSGSVYNVRIFAMYEGAGSHQNMVKVLRTFLQDIEEMQSERFSLCGHKVKIFLEGDYHFLDDCLGHQGSSATYPSAKI